MESRNFNLGKSVKTVFWFKFEMATLASFSDLEGKQKKYPSKVYFN